ncbi:hypothetical protein BST29_20135 [Mycobacterium malmoense]|uniref:Uncharacterized protein n=1 Tax=Mycobacterium malmoense TaxID=1780 RepID=A0ABX3SMM3_MYCMA|nr:hypothetical protein BMG05_24225 [Mycobacterium malmoense]ORA78935.1 hypothetical protein BST29_20135 [Mycobacterium malmoense]
MAAPAANPILDSHAQQGRNGFPRFGRCGCVEVTGSDAVRDLHHAIIGDADALDFRTRRGA